MEENVTDHGELIYSIVPSDDGEEFIVPNDEGIVIPGNDEMIPPIGGIIDYQHLAYNGSSYYMSCMEGYLSSYNKSVYCELSSTQVHVTWSQPIPVCGE